MKKIISFTLVISIMATLMTVLPTTVSAATSGICGDNLTWSLYGGTLTISGTGDMYDMVISPWSQLQDNITAVNVLNGVTSIGEMAFESLLKVTSITIPDSVTHIGTRGLAGMDELVSITIPNSVTNIGEEAFCGNKSLTSIEIPNSVTNMGDGAFLFCTNLNNVTLPDSITSIGENTFRYCHNLTSIEIQNSISSIGNGVFYGCNSLTNIYYSGDEDEWKRILIDSDNEELRYATIHYNSNNSVEKLQKENYTISITKNLILNKTEERTIQASLRKNGEIIFEDLTWKSSNESVVKIIDYGEDMTGTIAYVEGISPGTATITACYGDVEASCDVTVSEIKVILNGEKIEFDQPPLIINDRVMVPIRAIFEAMGYSVNWSGDTQIAEATKLNNTIKVQVNNDIIRYKINGKSMTYKCDVMPQIISGRILVPVRAIAECAGCDVKWNDENRMVIITYNEEQISNDSPSNSIKIDFKATDMDSNGDFGINIDFNSQIEAENVQIKFEGDSCIDPVWDFNKDWEYSSSTRGSYGEAIIGIGRLNKGLNSIVVDMNCSEKRQKGACNKSHIINIEVSGDNFKAVKGEFVVNEIKNNLVTPIIIPTKKVTYDEYLACKLKLATLSKKIPDKIFTKDTEYNKTLNGVKECIKAYAYDKEQDVPNEVYEAYAKAILRVISDDGINIDKLDTNMNKMTKQIYKQVKSGIDNFEESVEIDGQHYIVSGFIAAMSWLGKLNGVSWATVYFNGKSIDLVWTPNDMDDKDFIEKSNEAIAGFGAVVAQLNSDLWKDFMSYYVVDTVELIGIRITKDNVDKVLDKTEKVIRAICGDKKDSKTLIDSMGETAKDELKNGIFKNGFKKFIEDNFENSDAIIKWSEEYLRVKDEFNKFEEKFKFSKETDETLRYYENIQKLLKELESQIN